jgi:molybdopterin molybdotransferase
MPWRQARALAAGSAAAGGTQQLALEAAAGRVLAAPIESLVSLPPADTAAMDGYAVAGPPPWRVIGSAAPGRPTSQRLTAGQAVEIATGALTPAGAEAVVTYESSLRVDDRVSSAEPSGRRHIRRTGEDLRTGDLLAEDGQEVTPALIGLAAHAGLTHVTVRVKPLVRVVVTGDEIITAGRPGVGQVRDALGPLLTVLVEQAGATFVGIEHVADGFEPLARALRSRAADVILVTGSSSAGASDHLHAVLAAMDAELVVDGVACRPGHPQSLARTRHDDWVLGLPGNPYAALVGWLTLAEPLLAGMLGRAPRRPLTLPVTGPVTPIAGRTRLAPVRILGGHAVAVDGSSAASLRAVAGADAIAVIEPSWVSGAAAELLPLR